MNLIELKNVNAYRGETQALKNLSLSLPLGQSHVILGPNGAGKTSLIKLISRELYHVHSESSYVKIFGQENVNIWQLREKIGLVSNDIQNNYQSLASGLEVVLSAFFGSVGVHQHHSVTNTMLESANRILNELKISELKDRKYLKLSTGQQRKLLLARALVHNPKAILLDEPTSGLDLKARFWFLKKMTDLCREGTSVILITHDPSEIVPEITHTTLLKNGQVFGSGEKTETLTSASLSKLFDIPILLSESEGYYQVTPTK